MTRSDDSSLLPQEYRNVQYHADLLLREACAHGSFPTPIDDLMMAAKLTVVDDEEIDESLLRRFLAQAKTGIAHLKSALTKVLGLFEPKDRLVVIEKNLPLIRMPFVKLHEAGHGYLPHQSGMYSLIHDCDKTLDPDTTDLFEREANVFASEVLFQGNMFADEAHDSAFSLKVPIRLAKKYGASNYSTFRRYVSSSPHASCLIALEPPRYNLTGGFEAEVRRIVVSKTFHTFFDSTVLFKKISEVHFLGPVVPLHNRRMNLSRKVKIRDRNGQERICVAEAFNTTHQVLVLICDSGLTSTFSIGVPAVGTFPSADD